MALHRPHEFWLPGRRDLNGGAGLGIPTLTGCTVSNAETTETNQLNTVAALKSIRDGIENTVNGFGCISLGSISRLSDGSYKIVLVHRSFPLNDGLNFAVVCNPHLSCRLARTKTASGQNRKSAETVGMSAAGGRADVIWRKADISPGMSGLGGRADVSATWPESPVLANLGH